MFKSLGKILGKGAMDLEDKNEAAEHSSEPGEDTQPAASDTLLKAADERPTSPEKAVPEAVSSSSDTTQVREVPEERTTLNGVKLEDISRQLEATSISQSSEVSKDERPIEETVSESTCTKTEPETPAVEVSEPVEDIPKPRPRAEDFFESETKVKEGQEEVKHEERVPSRNSAHSERQSHKGEEEPVSDNPLNRSAAEEEILSSIEHVEDWAEEEKEEVEEEEGEEELNEEDEEGDEEDDDEEDETTEKEVVDFDRDRRNPQFIPRGGAYYLHDDRLESSEDDETSETEADAESSGVEVSQDKKPQSKVPKKVSKTPTKERTLSQVQKKAVKGKLEGDKATEAAAEGGTEGLPQQPSSSTSAKSNDKWTHDLFDAEAQQGPSSGDLQSRYGYDIRGDDHAPRGKRNRRYARPNDRQAGGGFRRRAGGRAGPERRLGSTNTPRGGASNVQADNEHSLTPTKAEQAGPSTSNQNSPARNNPPPPQKNTPQSTNRPSVEPRQPVQSQIQERYPERYPERKKVVEKYPAPSRQRQPPPQRDYQYSYQQDNNYGSSDQYDNSSSDPNNANAFQSRVFFGRGRGRGGGAGRTRGRGERMGPPPSQRPLYRENRSGLPTNNYSQPDLRETIEQNRMANAQRGASQPQPIPQASSQLPRGPTQSHSNIQNTQGPYQNSAAAPPPSKRYSSRGGAQATVPFRGGPSRGSGQKENIGHESGDVRALGSGYSQPSYSQRGGQNQGYVNQYAAVPPPNYVDPNAGYYPSPQYYGPPATQPYYPDYNQGYYQ
ncbi:hypothetical protein RvY_17002 [Ramazzottius varieornatus]|uniref:Protein CASC3 n=1 Tax=Ramazzottius varieornatus TaxID=947166 RepID=A0A1D1W0K2_RAMVA|nr:hypothetical protein RvY_17002 [Ramazzottius varieornatus]